MQVSSKTKSQPLVTWIDTGYWSDELNQTCPLNALSSDQDAVPSVGHGVQRLPVGWIIAESMAYCPSIPIRVNWH